MPVSPAPRNRDAPNPSLSPPLIPQEDPDQKLPYLAAAVGTRSALLLLVVFFSAPWAVIHVGRTLFLFSDFKASISLVCHKEEPGPKLCDFRTAHHTRNDRSVCTEWESQL